MIESNVGENLVIEIEIWTSFRFFTKLNTHSECFIHILFERNGNTCFELILFETFEALLHEIQLGVNIVDTHEFRCVPVYYTKQIEYKVSTNCYAVLKTF